MPVSFSAYDSRQTLPEAQIHGTLDLTSTKSASCPVSHQIIQSGCGGNFSREWQIPSLQEIAASRSPSAPFFDIIVPLAYTFDPLRS